MESGGLGWSSAQLMPKLPKQLVAKGKNLLEFSATSVALKRGTYSVNAMCLKPATGKLIADVSAKPNNAAFKLLGGSVSAKMGDAMGCASMGCSSGTRATTHTVYWTVGNGTEKYTSLPPTYVTVTRTKATVRVPSTITCSYLGSSVPMVVTLSDQPFSDIKVGLKKHLTKDGTTEVDNSKGMTIAAASAAGVAMDVNTDEVVLGFSCAAKPTEAKDFGTALAYTLAGTDASVF